MDGILPPGAEKGQPGLQKVVNERRRKRHQKLEAKREERRDKLLSQEQQLLKLREKKAAEQ